MHTILHTPCDLPDSFFDVHLCTYELEINRLSQVVAEVCPCIEESAAQTPELRHEAFGWRVPRQKVRQCVTQQLSCWIAFPHLDTSCSHPWTGALWLGSARASRRSARNLALRDGRMVSTESVVCWIEKERSKKVCFFEIRILLVREDRRGEGSRRAGSPCRGVCPDNVGRVSLCFRVYFRP